MARLNEFERELKVATAGLDDDAIAKLLAETAEEARDAAISAGEASAHYETFVNYEEGRSEEQVKPPGPIIYVFDYGIEIAQFALELARALSPVRSGAYRDAWFLLDESGAQTTPENLTPGAPFTITNDKPYARKIEVGAMKVSVPPGIVERLRKGVLGRYGNSVSAKVKFIKLEGGYVLKRHGTGGRQRRRDERAAGTAINYPALVVAPR